MAGVVLAPSSVTVVPGGDAVCTVTIRNSSAVVESYTITVLGDAAAWATATPAALSLFPGTDGTCNIHFRPARNASVPAGTVDFGVRVAATQNSDDTVVEEGTVTVAPFTEIAARITPRTSETKRRARHVVTIDNRGNAPVTVMVSAADPDESLAFETEPDTVTIDPGDTGASTVKVAARSGMLRGPAQHRPFQVTVSPPVDAVHSPIVLDGTLMQKAGMPRFVPLLAAAAVIVVLAAVLLPALTKGKDKGGGFFSLTGANATTTTAAAAGGEDLEEAEAEVETAKPKTTAAPVTTAAARTNTTLAAAGSGGQAAATTTTAGVTEEDTTETTARSTATTAAPVVLPRPKAGLPVLFPSFESDSDEEIWKINPDGSGKAKLTNGNNASHAWSVAPRWNYAGTLIAYTHSPVATYTRAWIMNPDGSNPHDATPSCDTSCGQPAWTPDGKQLAYIKTAGSQNDIWIADVSASGASSNHRPLVATPEDEQYPAFAPDGRLAFQRNSGGWKVIVRQTSGAESVAGIGYHPSWSPNNDRLLYTDGNDVFVSKLDGSGATNLSPGGGADQWPMWSPDGGTIGFSTTRFGGIWHVALANADGTNIRQLTSGAWPSGLSGQRRHWWVGWF